MNFAIQINGKLRSTMEMPAGIGCADAIARVKADTRIAALLADKQVVKEIFVPDKIVNLVVK